MMMIVSLKNTRWEDKVSKRVKDVFCRNIVMEDDEPDFRNGSGEIEMMMESKG
jgi:hypothetical protein